MEIDESSEMADAFSDIVTDKRGVVDDRNTAKKSLSSMERLGDAYITLYAKNYNFISWPPKYSYYDLQIHFLCREEIVALLDKIDNQVEELRREAFTLQEKRDNLMTKIDMMKHVDLLTNLDKNDRDDINLQLKRINERLQVTWNFFSSPAFSKNRSL